MELRGSRNIVCGLGRSGEALISYLDKKGAEILVSDKRKSENEIADVLANKGIKNAKIIKYGDFPKADFVYRTPAIRPDAPEILSAIQKGAILTSEAELFFNIAKGKLIGITGSDGKTTTTTLTYEILKRKQGVNNTFIGGNIGIPLISLADKLKNDSITVCELSSFQLMSFKRSPHVSAVTNITENHLDYHRDMSEYVLAKSNVFVHEDCQRLVIDSRAYSVLKEYVEPSKCEVMTFSLDGNITDIALDNGYIKLFGKKILPVSAIKAGGTHNVKNFMTAIGLTYGFADISEVMAVAESFKGVANRCELVGEKDGTVFINSSVDSTPSRTLMTLKSLPYRDITVILGGYDKNLDFRELSEYINEKNIKAVLIGANKVKIKRSLLGYRKEVNNVYEADDLTDGVNVAMTVTRRGGCILLSPASASFDMFKDYEERGDVFKNIIKTI